MIADATASFSPAQALDAPCAAHELPDDFSPMTFAAAARSLLIACVGFLLGLAVAAVAVPIAASAQDTAPPPKTRSVIVYGDDPCPRSDSDEIVVCARQPEGERYRIPKQFRGQKAAASPAGNSFSNKVRATDDNSRMAAGVPNSCSAVGAAGQSGCFLQMQQQAAAWRQAKKNGQLDDDQP